MIAEEADEKTIVDGQARQKSTERIIKYIEKKQEVEEKLLQLRFLTEQDDEEKEMGLKQLADEVQDIEKKISAELDKSHSDFINQLQLGEIKMSHLAEKKDAFVSVPIREPSVAQSPRGELSPTMSAGNQSSTEEGSSAPITGYSGVDSLISLVLDFFSSEPERPSSAPTTSRDLSALEEEIAQLRANIHKLERKKTLSTAQQKSLKDTKEQLRLRLGQREKISREEYHNRPPQK